MTKGSIYAEYWIRCGRCNKSESLATTNKAIANEERSKRGWMMRRAYGLICPDCRQEIADLAVQAFEKDSMLRAQGRRVLTIHHPGWKSQE